MIKRFDLYSILLQTVDDFLSSKTKNTESPNSTLNKIKTSAEKSGRSIINELTFENYSYYLVFVHKIRFLRYACHKNRHLQE